MKQNKGSKKTILVVGAGHVGYALALSLSLAHDVVIYDTDPAKREAIKSKRPPFPDAEAETFLTLHKNLAIAVAASLDEAYRHIDIAIYAVPTDYDEATKRFDLSILESVLEKGFSNRPDILHVIKSTIPVGFTRNAREKYKGIRLFFSPEFLRESHAIEDCLRPSRIIVGFDQAVPEDSSDAETIADILSSCAKSPVPTRLVGLEEAEAIKLFANAYLAARISFFNELDTFALTYGYEAGDIIDGVCLDPRIGTHYNNPSFGYGGYCLPKDTKELDALFSSLPHHMVSASIAANASRKKAIAEDILRVAKEKSSDPLIGIYRLGMKKDSDSLRQSAVIDVLELLKETNARLLIYDPSLNDESFHDVPVTHNLNAFIEKSDLIVANRVEEVLLRAKEKVYSRDLFFRD